MTPKVSTGQNKDSEGANPRGLARGRRAFRVENKVQKNSPGAGEAVWVERGEVGAGRESVGVGSGACRL